METEEDQRQREVAEATERLKAEDADRLRQRAEKYAKKRPPHPRNGTP
jgi:hypothetical protein